MSPRTFTAEPLHVAAGMPGAPLASPLRRAIAFGVDLAVLIIPSVLIAVAAALLALSVSDPQAVAGMRAHRRRSVHWSPRLVAFGSEKPGRICGYSRDAAWHQVPDLIEVKRPGALAWNRRAVAAAMEQAPQRPMLYAADIEHGSLHDRVFVSLEAPGEKLHSSGRY